MCASGTEKYVPHTMKNVPHFAKMCTTTSKKGQKSSFFDPLLWYNFGTFLLFVYQSYNTILILPNAKLPYKNLARKLLKYYKSD